MTILGHAPLLEQIARAYSSCQIILCHCGMPPHAAQWQGIAQWEGSADSVDYWKSLSEQPLQKAFDAVLAMAQFANVALKWAHAPAYFTGGGYPNVPTRFFLRQAVNAFGAQRIMWASDFTTNQTGETWAELLFALRQNTELSDDERGWVLGASARKLLSIEI